MGLLDNPGKKNNGNMTAKAKPITKPKASGNGKNIKKGPAPKAAR